MSVNPPVEIDFKYGEPTSYLDLIRLPWVTSEIEHFTPSVTRWHGEGEFCEPNPPEDPHSRARGWFKIDQTLVAAGYALENDKFIITRYGPDGTYPLEVLDAVGVSSPPDDPNHFIFSDEEGVVVFEVKILAGHRYYHGGESSE